ncbi:MAG TPA: hypothetical protein VGX96_19075 [Candidatus Elarobacter sp.]|jgi:hypothetical protein|nr:hypothetical protein [Candidatus Elarobacter sp.]
MYVRFVGTRIDSSSGKREGIFHAAGALRRSGALSAADAARLDGIELWFDENLSKPARFARARRHHPAPVAISWFRSEARAHLARIREMQQILEAYGCTIEMIKTARPGYVVYEDDAQVTARPFNDTPA